MNPIVTSGAARRLAPALLLLTSAPALAGDCETNFKREGNPLTGLRYTSNVSVEGVTPASAIAQMAAIGRKGGYDVLEEDGANGVLILEQPESVMARSFPISVTAESEGTATRVGVLVKMNRGALTTGGAVSKELCSMLAQMRPGAAGRAVAASGNSQAPPQAMLATNFASMVGRQANENYAMVNPRYKGKRYTLKGWASNVHGSEGRYAVFFKREGEVGNQDRIGSMFNVQVMCRMAADAKGYAMTLREGERINLTGTFNNYDNRVIELVDCRPAK